VTVSTADRATRIREVVVAVIDVGSNSVRLLVAAVDESGEVRQLHRERVYLRLGDDAYRLGRISREKLDETRSVASSFARIAEEAGAERLETIVTAPGRQASNPEELVQVLAKATRAPVVVLSAEDEGCLAWEGAVSRLEAPPDVVAAVDLGGGSCEVAVGTPTLGPVWVRSFDAGALRVTRAFLNGDPPSAENVAEARGKIARLADIEPRPPRPDLTLAVGGTARAVSRIVGRRFDAEDLDELAARLSRLPTKKAAARLGITTARAETLLGGTLVLAEIARLVDTGLELGRGGLREGAALALARAEAVAA
jgi:exopolyphosphatase/guanosine-5'-triphosphate,3'-diphosphate pyrophosphatase